MAHILKGNVWQSTGAAPPRGYNNKPPVNAIASYNDSSWHLTLKQITTHGDIYLTYMKYY